MNTLIAAESLKPLAAGSRLQEFVIERVLGMGGFGVVYLACDTLLNRTVAIKEYMPNHMVSRNDGLTVTLKSESYAQDFETGKTSFINEARMLARFKHAALIEVFRFWEQNSTAYMATPFYDGCTLKEFLSARVGTVDEATLKGMLFPILDALQHMHQEKVYHRDISPDNIMILKDGRPILLDLGAARAIEIESAQALTVLVKPGYAPIEQYGGDSNRDQGPWTDIYGVGASAYFALVGKPPPPSASRVMRDAIIKLADLKPSGYSAAFLNAMDAALAVRPDDRPQSIASLKAMFQTNQSDEPVLVSKTKPLNTVKLAVAQSTKPASVAATVKNLAAPASTKKKSSRLVIGGALLVSLVAVGTWLALSTNARPTVSASIVTPSAVSPSIRNPILVEATKPSVVATEPTIAPPPPLSAANSEDLKPLAIPSELSAVAVSPEKQPEVADKPATARFSIKPWGEIFVNNESKGVSPPLKAMSLPAGNYAIEVRNGDYPSYKTNLTLKAGETIRINHAFIDNGPKTSGQ